MEITVYQLQAKALRKNGGCPLQFADKNLSLHAPTQAQRDSFTKVCKLEAAKQDIEVLESDIFLTVHIQLLHFDSLETLLRKLVTPPAPTPAPLIPIESGSSDMLDRLIDYVSEIIDLEPSFAVHLLQLIKDKLV